MDFDPGLAEYPCTNCTERLGFVHIECAICDDVRLCLECFSCGAELGRHERTHNYKVKNTRGKIIFQDESCGRDPLYSSDEMALLEAVERFNLGNWDDVATHVSSPTWTPKDLRDHYDKYYLHGKIAKATKLNLKPPQIKDHCSNEISDTCNRDIVSKVNADDLTMIAYMPNRDDFEKEYNNEAENVLANLTIIPDDDDEIDKSIKLAHIDSYVRQLVERKRRHDLIHDYDLITKFFKQEKPQPYSSVRYTIQANIKRKRERELKDSLKKCSQLLPSEEFDDLIDSIVREKFLKERIEQLQEMQKKGVTTFGEVLENGNTCVAGTKGLRPKAAIAVQTPLDPKTNIRNKKFKFNESKQSKIQHSDDNHTFSLSEEPDNNYLLSVSEKTTCQLYSIAPEHYKLLKMDLLINNERRRRSWTSFSNENFVEMEEDCLRMRNFVQTFMSECGWLP